MQAPVNKLLLQKQTNQSVEFYYGITYNIIFTRMPI